MSRNEARNLVAKYYLAITASPGNRTRGRSLAYSSADHPRHAAWIDRFVIYYQSGFPLDTNSPDSNRKSQIDAVLLKLPGASTKKINGLDAYFVSDRMFACISGQGVGLRLPVAAATELQFSRDNVVPFQPAGLGSTREWIQIDRADAADYEKDLELFRASLEFVKAGRSR
jgi:hypothetical protein